MTVLSKPNQIPFKDLCLKYHPWSTSCSTSASQVWFAVFLAGLKLYAPLFLVPALIFKRKGLHFLITRTLPEILRSSVFLGTYAGVFSGCICLFRSIIGKDLKLIPGLSGFFAGLLSILIERKSRRSELALYCSNQSIEIAWKMLAARGMAFFIPNGEVLVFMFASAILMYFYQREPDSLRSNMNGLLKFFIGQN
ncbi:transmembrane protein [Tieghemostelium lacteum]|uniref:Transmembrane protein n=1 Tax=Tieghemostelium lacteum TaxID=361077 RepID=A0A151Z616_TIELA|nr:transmembrane protein [Tieghemostelium lacteum]|eukprot:KYQ89400.1 transmembrane protein [Tieghemostelium lacteum]